MRADKSLNMNMFFLELNMNMLPTPYSFFLVLTARDGGQKLFCSVEWSTDFSDTAIGVAHKESICDAANIFVFIF